MAQEIGEKGEPTGAASPRYRIILIRRNFLVDLRDMVISSYRRKLFYHNIELTLICVSHALEKKKELRRQLTSKGTFGFLSLFPLPLSRCRSLSSILLEFDEDPLSA